MEALSSGPAEQLQQQPSPLDAQRLEAHAKGQPSHSSELPRRRSDKEIYGMNMAGKGWYKLAKLEEERERREEEALANKCPVTIIKRSWTSVRNKLSWRRSSAGTTHEEKQEQQEQTMYGPVDKPVPPPSFRGGVFQLHGRARGDSLSSSSEYDDDSLSSCGSPQSLPEVPASADSDNSIAETQPPSSNTDNSPFRQAVSSAAARLNPNPAGTGGPAPLERWTVGFGPRDAGGEDDGSRRPGEEVHDFHHHLPVQPWAQLGGPPHRLHHLPFGHDEYDGRVFHDGTVAVAADLEDAEPARLGLGNEEDVGRPGNHNDNHIRAFAGAGAGADIPFEIHELGPRQRRQRAALQFGTDAATPWLWYARMLTPLTLLSAPWRTLLGLSGEDGPEFDSEDDAEEETEHEDEEEDELEEGGSSSQGVSTVTHTDVVPSTSTSGESTDARPAADSTTPVPHHQRQTRRREVARCPICQRRLHYRQKQRRCVNSSESAARANDPAVCGSGGCVEDGGDGGTAPVIEDAQDAVFQADAAADEELQAQKEARRRKRRQVLQLACGHSFHRHCIWKWIVKLQGRTCPICRDEVDWPSEVTASVVKSSPP